MLHVREHFGLARRLVDVEPRGLLLVTDRQRARRRARSAARRAARRSRRSGARSSSSRLTVRSSAIGRTRRLDARTSRRAAMLRDHAAPARCRRRRRRPIGRPAPRARATRCRTRARPAATTAPARARSARATSAAKLSRTPVTPSREMTYRNPRPSSADRRIRASVVVGLSRKIGSSPASTSGAAKRLGFFDRLVEDQHAVHAGVAAARAKPSDPSADRVRVGEQHDRRRDRVPHRARPHRARRAASSRRPARARSRAGSPGRRPADRRTARRLRARRRRLRERDQDLGGRRGGRDRRR